MAEENKSGLKTNIISGSIVCLIASAFIFAAVYMSRNCCFWGDDYEFAMYQNGEGIFGCLFGINRLEHGGYYIGKFLCKFLSFGLPNMLGIHPADFIGMTQGVFKGFFSLAAVFILLKFLSGFNKSRILYISALVFTCCYMLSAFRMSCTMVTNYAFYRYCFSLIFFGYFWLYIMKNIKQEPERALNIPALVFACFCGFTLGTSIEISIFSSIILCLMILMFSKPLKYRLNINFYLPFLFLASGAGLFLSSHGFIETASDRMLPLSAVFENLSGFIKTFFDIGVKQELIYWTVFSIPACASFHKAFKQNKFSRDINILSFPVLFQISLFISMFSLVLCGKTYHENEFWIEHRNIIFLYKMLLLYPLFIYAGYFIKLTNYKPVVIYSAAFICIFSGLCFMPKILNGEKAYLSDDFMFQRKKEAYMTDKIMRFYFLKGLVPEIPKEIAVNNMSLINYDLNNKDIIYDNKYLTYYEKIYKDKSVKKKGYKYSKDGFKKFYENGGVFEDSELENINFSKLFDEDFVLGKN